MASADARLPGPLVALAAGQGRAYAVVATGSRTQPFRLLRSSGRSATSLGAFGSPGAEFADVAAGPAGPVTVFGRPTSDGYSYELSGGAKLGEGTGPPVLVVDGEQRFVAYPDDDGDVVLGTATLTHSGPSLRHAPVDVVGGPTVLDLVQSASRTELRVLGPEAPTAPLTSIRGLHAIPAAIARDAKQLLVAYRLGNRVTLATAPARASGRWTRRRLRTKGTLNGAPAMVRVGLRTLIATSRQVRGRRAVYLTTIGPAGTLTKHLSRGRTSDAAPLAAEGLDGHVYVAWTRRATGSSRRFAVLRRVL